MKRISQIAPEVIELSEKCIKNNNIDPALYKNCLLYTSPLKAQTIVP